MAKQRIIAIGREYGSGGHKIGEILAKRYGIPLYDKEMIELIAKEKNLDLDELKKYDEIPRNRLFSRTVNGFSNSPEETISQMQFDFLREKANSGESFVVVGRCATSILKDNENMVSIFVTGDLVYEATRISKMYRITEVEGEAMVEKVNKQRKQYHNYYCKEKWGDSRHYDLIINSSRVGIQNAADIIDSYIKLIQTTE